MLSDIDPETLAKAAAELGAPSVRADVSRAADVEAAVAATVDAFGGIDILVNNAGIEQVSPLVEHDEADFDLIFSINVKGVFLGLKYGAPAIIASGGGPWSTWRRSPVSAPPSCSAPTGPPRRRSSR